jgi:hypothetical protein
MDYAEDLGIWGTHLGFVNRSSFVQHKESLPQVYYLQPSWLARPIEIDEHTTVAEILQVLRLLWPSPTPPRTLSLLCGSTPCAETDPLRRVLGSPLSANVDGRDFPFNGGEPVEAYRPSLWARVGMSLRNLSPWH